MAEETPHILIGSGPAALAAAIDLAVAGQPVLVLEKEPKVGGKAVGVDRDGFRFDTGPTVLTMPFVLDALFASSGVLREEYLPLLRVEPTCRYHWSDGTVLDAWSDRTRLLDAVERAVPGASTRVGRYLDEAATLYRATADLFLFNSFSIASALHPSRLSLLPLLPRLGLLSRLHRRLERRLGEPKLVQLFDRFATYNGSSPYRAPATLSIIPHVELAFGAWYPQEGGMRSVPLAMARRAGELGVEIRTDTAVRALRRTGRTVTGVVTDTGVLPCRSVLSTVDALWTYRTLLAPVDVRPSRTLERAERSCSGFLVHAEVEGIHASLPHHSIFFADEYSQEFADIFERRRLPRSGTIYVSIAARSDPRSAPIGCENWYMLANAPSGGVDHSDALAHERYAESMFVRLGQFGLQPQVRAVSRITPLDVEMRDNAVGGALYGAASHSFASAFLRPQARVPGLDNMLLAGGTVHPGGGVPLAILSGRIAARELLGRVR